MLLSMLMSFLLAKMLHGKVYVFATAIGLFLMSFFSVGIPHHLSFTNSLLGPMNGIVFDEPLPLSFPFHSSLGGESTISYSIQDYQFYFLTWIFYTHGVQAYFSGAYKWLGISWFSYFVYFLFFMVVNIVGATMGYWTSKRMHINLLSRIWSRKLKIFKDIASLAMLIILLFWSVYSLYKAYQIWYAYHDVLDMFLPYTVSGSASLIFAIAISAEVMRRRFQKKQPWQASLPKRESDAEPMGVY